MLPEWRAFILLLLIFYKILKLYFFAHFSCNVRSVSIKCAHKICTKYDFELRNAGGHVDRSVLRI